MDGQRFDAFTRAMARGSTRRSIVRGLAALTGGGLLGGFGGRGRVLATTTCTPVGEECTGGVLSCCTQACDIGTGGTNKCCVIEGEDCDGNAANCCSGLCDVEGTGTCVLPCSEEEGCCGGVGESCCGDLVCFDGLCRPPDTCNGEEGSCIFDEDCCDGLTCILNTCSAGCTAEGDSCSSDSDCCGLLTCENGSCEQTCAFLVEHCDAETPCCEPLRCYRNDFCTDTCSARGETCNDDSSCCNIADSCQDGTCQAIPICGEIGDSCDADDDCCTESFLACDDGACVQTCKPDLNNCFFDAECCNGGCINGVCGAAVCGDEGDTCCAEDDCTGDFSCCTDGLACSGGVCAAVCGEAGNACGNDDGCCGDLVCGDAGTCVESESNPPTCSGDGDPCGDGCCDGLVCDDGTCAEPAPPASGTATVTIHLATCPTGTGDIFGQCHDHGLGGVTFTISSAGDFTAAATGTITTDGSGVAGATVGVGAVTVAEDPGVANDYLGAYVYCSEQNSSEVLYDGSAGSAVVGFVVGDGDEVICDWYTITAADGDDSDDDAGGSGGNTALPSTGAGSTAGGSSPWLGVAALGAAAVLLAGKKVREGAEPDAPAE